MDRAMELLSAVAGHCDGGDAPSPPKVEILKGTAERHSVFFPWRQYENFAENTCRRTRPIGFCGPGPGPEGAQTAVSHTLGGFQTCGNSSRGEGHDRDRQE